MFLTPCVWNSKVSIFLLILNQIWTVRTRILLARLSQRVWTTALRGKVNQELKLSPTHLALNWLGW